MPHSVMGKKEWTKVTVCQFHKDDSCWFNILDIRMTYDVKTRDGYVMESYNIWTTWTTWTTGSWISGVFVPNIKY